MPAGSQRKRPTSADVARASGLSRATVSYVLNNTPHQVIPEPTRQRVLAAAASLGYVPSAAARALSSGRSDVVLLLLPDWPIGPGVGRLLEGLSAAFAARGLTFVVHPAAVTGRPVTEVWKAITPAAVITFDPLGDDEVATMLAAGISLTVALFGTPHAPAVDLSEERSGRLQVEHLAAAGHRRIGYAQSDEPRVRVFAEARLDGARQSCAELGLPEPVVRTVPLTVPGAADAVRSWLAHDPAVTAVGAYNDEVALAVLAGARSAGVLVPGQLAVIGVDDIPAAALAVPSLTTVTGDTQVSTAHLADSIVATLAGRPLPGHPASDTHHVIDRDSV